MSEALTIRAIESADWPAVWRLLEPALRGGETVLLKGIRDLEQWTLPGADVATPCGL